MSSYLSDTTLAMITFEPGRGFMRWIVFSLLLKWLLIHQVMSFPNITSNSLDVSILNVAEAAGSILFIALIVAGESFRQPHLFTTILTFNACWLLLNRHFTH